jgi:hypothetical protein
MTPQKGDESYQAAFSERFLIPPEIESLSLTLLDFDPNVPHKSTRVSQHVRNENPGRGNETGSQREPRMPRSLSRGASRTGIVAASEPQTFVPNSLSRVTSIHDPCHILVESSKPCSKDRWASIWQPILMICYAVSGIIVALTHHLYYLSLRGKQSRFRQSSTMGGHIWDRPLLSRYSSSQKCHYRSIHSIRMEPGEAAIL